MFSLISFFYIHMTNNRPILCADGTLRRDDEMKVVALEDVVVPAGKFKAYKIELIASLKRGQKCI